MWCFVFVFVCLDSTKFITVHMFRGKNSACKIGTCSDSGSGQTRMEEYGRNISKIIVILLLLFPLLKWSTHLWRKITFEWKIRSFFIVKSWLLVFRILSLSLCFLHMLRTFEQICCALNFYDLQEAQLYSYVYGERKAIVLMSIWFGGTVTIVKINLRIHAQFGIGAVGCRTIADTGQFDECVE